LARGAFSKSSHLLEEKLASTIGASGAGKGDCCVGDRTSIEGKAAASDAEGLQKEMGEVRSINVAGASTVGPFEGYGQSLKSTLNDVDAEKSERMSWVRLISSSGFSPDAYKRKSQSEIAPKSTERGDQGLEVVPRYGVKCFKVRNI